MAGARDVLVRHGVKDDAIDLIRVPGAWEIALAATSWPTPANTSR